jgi:hypothetical protein
MHGCHFEAIKMAETRLEKLLTFEAAPIDTLFDQSTVAAVRGVSTGNIERERWQGRGIPFRRIGGSIRYSKRDILAWLSQHPAVRSTAEARAQALRLREVCHE